MVPSFFSGLLDSAYDLVPPTKRLPVFLLAPIFPINEEAVSTKVVLSFERSILFFFACSFASLVNFLVTLPVDSLPAGLYSTISICR